MKPIKGDVVIGKANCGFAGAAAPLSLQVRPRFSLRAAGFSFNSV